MTEKLQRSYRASGYEALQVLEPLAQFSHCAMRSNDKRRCQMSQVFKHSLKHSNIQAAR